MKTRAKIVGKNFRIAREIVSLNMRDVAKILEVTHATIGNFELGKGKTINETFVKKYFDLLLSKPGFPPELSFDDFLSRDLSEIFTPEGLANPRMGEKPEDKGILHPGGELVSPEARIPPTPDGYLNDIPPEMVRVNSTDPPVVALNRYIVRRWKAMNLDRRDVGYLRGLLFRLRGPGTQEEWDRFYDGQVELFREVFKYKRNGG